MTKNRELSKLGSYITVNSSTDTVDFGDTLVTGDSIGSTETGISSTSSINTTGIITASSFYGDGSNLINLTGVPVAAGCITLNGTSPTWSGTAGYTVSGTQPGGAGTDYVITLTFPTAYSARTDYIVQVTYDSTNYVSGNGASIGVARGTASVVFTPRRWDENPLSLGEIMVTITNL